MRKNTGLFIVLRVFFVGARVVYTQDWPDTSGMAVITEPHTLCYSPNELLYHSGNFCFNVTQFVFDPIFVPDYGFDLGHPTPRHECGVLENFYQSRRFTHSFQTAVSELQQIPAPPAPGVYSKQSASDNGIPDFVPIPCKPCETDRKDRKFIRGLPYKPSMTKLLVDHASGQAGGKILAHAESLRGVSDIIHSDYSRYMLTACSDKVWFTLKLADEVFIEKVGITASELFASTFRHIQVLGSKQYPTSEWRVLGEIETNPMENQEWFDLSGSSQCSKCYVKYLKFRVLTHHTLEGYTRCALTRVQVFGSTVLQSLDKIQANTTDSEHATASKTPGFFVRTPEQLLDFFDPKLKTILGLEYHHDQQEPAPTTTPPPQEVAGSHPADHPTPEEPPSPSDENFPLLKFIEEMTSLKKQYAAVTSNLQILQDIVAGRSGNMASTTVAKGGSQTTPPETAKELTRQTDPPGGKLYVVSVLGYTFRTSAWGTVETVAGVAGLLVCLQFIVILTLSRNRQNAQPKPSTAAAHAPPMRRELSYPQSRRKPTPAALRPTKVRRSISFMHYMKELKKHSLVPVVVTPEPPSSPPIGGSDSPLFHRADSI